MDNKDINAIILSNFKKEMEPELRHILINFFNQYNNYYSNKTELNKIEPKKNLLQIEESYNMITNKLEKQYFKNENIIKYNKLNVLEKIKEDYIMLTDCINNYDENNISLKNKIVNLLTEIEILLGMSITYPSEMKNSIENLIYNKKGSDDFVRRKDFKNK